LVVELYFISGARIICPEVKLRFIRL